MGMVYPEKMSSRQYLFYLPQLMAKQQLFIGMEKEQGIVAVCPAMDDLFWVEDVDSSLGG